MFQIIVIPKWQHLTHWGQVTHIRVGKLTIIGSDNGLSPGRRQAIIRTNAGILLIGTLGTNISEILSEIHTFSFKKMHLKMSSGRWRTFCLGLNVLIKTQGQLYVLKDWLIVAWLNFYTCLISNAAVLWAKCINHWIWIKWEQNKIAITFKSQWMDFAWTGYLA